MRCAPGLGSRAHKHSILNRRMPCSSMVYGGLQLTFASDAGGGAVWAEAGGATRVVVLCGAIFTRSSANVRSMFFSKVITFVSVVNPAASARIECCAESDGREPE